MDDNGSVAGLSPNILYIYMYIYIVTIVYRQWDRPNKNKTGQKETLAHPLASPTKTAKKQTTRPIWHLCFTDHAHLHEISEVKHGLDLCILPFDRGLVPSFRRRAGAARRAAPCGQTGKKLSECEETVKSFSELLSFSKLIVTSSQEFP